MLTYRVSLLFLLRTHDSHIPFYLFSLVAIVEVILVCHIYSSNSCDKSFNTTLTVCRLPQRALVPWSGLRHRQALRKLASCDAQHALFDPRPRAELSRFVALEKRRRVRGTEPWGTPCAECG